MQSSAQKANWKAGKAGLRAKPAALPILAVFVLIGIITFLYSPAFNVREITVEGNLFFSDNEVIALAMVPRDRNMLLISAEAIASRIAMAPRVEKASVRKRYPSRMEITVAERKTAAYLPYGGFFVDLDREGLAIGVSEAVTDQNVPIITGMVPSFVLLGEKVRPEQQAALACLIGRMLAERNVPDISEVNVKEASDIVIITNEGSRIMLGAADGIEGRLSLAVDMLAGARSRKQAFKYIDVRIAERPVLGTR
ncbi:MAG TPA: FtsQ-type POTRA domain-containing protein [Bacillota bacterium]|nr:FtsQ-type POTRA domain-containing protein [Bacillota bacterium]